MQGPQPYLFKTDLTDGGRTEEHAAGAPLHRAVAQEGEKVSSRAAAARHGAEDNKGEWVGPFRQTFGSESLHRPPPAPPSQAQRQMA